jgi:hypothetical protein
MGVSFYVTKSVGTILRLFVPTDWSHKKQFNFEGEANKDIKTI